MTEAVPEKKRFIESSCLFTNKVDNPFEGLQIDDSDFLNDVPQRDFCTICNKSRRFYCYNCYVPVTGINSKIPLVKLPVKIDIIKHPKEVDGKSTSAHVAVLASKDVRVYTYPDFPKYDKEKVLLIFPGKSARPLKQIFEDNLLSSSDESHNLSAKDFVNVDVLHKHKCQCVDDLKDLSHIKASDSSSQCEDEVKSTTFPSFPFERIIFIDSTWRQTKKLYSDPLIKSLPCCVLTSHKSLFWRHQRGKPENHLATVEAVYYFLVELHQLMYPKVQYCGRYDNLLFFFKFMYYKIRTLYDPSSLKAYQT